MSFLPPWIKRLNPMTAIGIDLSELSRVDNEKSLTVAGVESLTFGEIAAATDVTLTFEFDASDSEDFAICAGVTYTGDADAFELNGSALVSGAEPVWIAIPPSTIDSPSEVTVTALAANDGVEKTGTITVSDRFTFTAGSGVPTRVLFTADLSKTYNAP